MSSVMRNDVEVSARERLLAAADLLVAERGPAGFTLREAARRAEVSHATPGFLFGDLRGLVTAVATGGFERFALTLETAESTGGDALTRLLSVGQAYVAFARSEPHIFRLMMGDEYLDHEHLSLTAENGRAYGVLSRCVKALYCIEVETPEVTQRILLSWSTVHGLARLILDGPLREQTTQNDSFIVSVIGALGPSLLAPLGDGTP